MIKERKGQEKLWRARWDGEREEREVHNLEGLERETERERERERERMIPRGKMEHPLLDAKN